MVRHHLRDLHAGTALREQAVDEHDEPVVSVPDAGPALVDVHHVDDDLLADLHGLLFQVRDGHVVVVAPLRATPVAVVLTPESFDSLGETRTVVREGAVGHAVR